MQGPFDSQTYSDDLNQIKAEIIKHSKRAIKKDIPKSISTRTDIRDNLVQQFNRFTEVVAKSWNFLDNTGKSNTKQTFYSVRDKVVRAFQALDVRYKVPISCIEGINPLVLEEDILEEKDNKLDTMALSTADFFSLASKLLPNQFDGNADNLKSFLDSLELLKLNCENHHDNATAFVKTRLTGKARDLINNENTIDEIILTLKNTIKGDSSSLVSSKLLHLKQNNKDVTNFAKDVEFLAEKLQKAFISEGVPYEVARKYTVETTVRALSQNASSDRARIVVEAGTFTSVPEVLTKFVNVGSTQNDPNILYLHRNRNPLNRSRNFRGRGYHQNYNTRQHVNRSRGGRGSRYAYNNRNVIRGRGNYSNAAVRFYESDQDPGNQSSPQRTRLGEM